MKIKKSPQEKQVQAEPTVEEESLDATVSDEAVESDKE